MIVISSALALSEEGADVNNGVILYDNLVTVASLTFTSEDADHPAANLVNPATHLFWRSSGLEVTEFMTTTFTGPTLVSAVGIARHNLGTIGATLRVWGTVSPVGDSPAIFVLLMDSRILADDAPFMLVFEPQVLTQVFIQIDLLSPTPEVEIGVWYVGEALFLERSIKIDTGHTPITMGRKTKVINGMSESGNFLGRILANEFRQGHADFEWFTPDWYRNYFDPFVDAASQVPFFYAWNPVEYPLEVGYVWLMEDPVPEVDPVTRRIGVALRYQGHV